MFCPYATALRPACTSSPAPRPRTRGRSGFATRLEHLPHSLRTTFDVLQDGSTPERQNTPASSLQNIPLLGIEFQSLRIPMICVAVAEDRHLKVGPGEIRHCDQAPLFVSDLVVPLAVGNPHALQSGPEHFLDLPLGVSAEGLLRVRALGLQHAAEPFRARTVSRFLWLDGLEAGKAAQDVAHQVFIEERMPALVAVVLEAQIAGFEAPMTVQRLLRSARHLGQPLGHLLQIACPTGNRLVKK